MLSSLKHLLGFEFHHERQSLVLTFWKSGLHFYTVWLSRLWSTVLNSISTLIATALTLFQVLTCQFNYHVKAGNKMQDILKAILNIEGNWLCYWESCMIVLHLCRSFCVGHVESEIHTKAIHQCHSVQAEHRWNSLLGTTHHFVRETKDVASNMITI